jgi:hypothetical protein
MALVLKDRVKETTTTTGTGTVTLAGASTGYQSFSVVGNANTTYYCIAGQGTAEWEVGIGTYTASGTTLSRDTILASSNSGSVVTFSAGTKDVFVVYPAGKSVNLDASGNATALGTPASCTVTNFTGTASININGTVGATTPNTGAFTSVTSTSASGVLTRAAATQDGVELVGRAGGTTSLKVTFTPTTLTASRTLTLPDASGTILQSGTAVTVAQGGTGITSGTSGGVPYFSSTSAIASSAALAANALVIGGGAGAAPSTTTTGTGVLTALGVNTGSAGAFVVNGGALGTPSSGTVTNLTGTASININGTVGATTPNTGAFTTLSASGVATFSAGSAAAPAITTSGDTNTGIFFPAADTIAFTEGGAEAMRIDSSGNVGIGTTSPSSKLEVYDATSAVARVTAGTEIFEIRNTGSEVRLAVVSADPMTFRTSNVEAMRIDSSGNLLIGGTTSYGKLTTYVGNNSRFAATTSSGAGGGAGGWQLPAYYGSVKVNYIDCELTDGTGGSEASVMRFATIGSGTLAERMRIDSSGNLLVGTTSGNADARTTIAQGSTDSSPCIDYQKGSATTTTAQVYARFFCNGGSTATGSITANGVSAATFTAYSDRRLKENIVDLPSQLNNIMSLRPVEFDYKGYPSGDGHQIGFIAQEVQSVYPDLVAEGDNGMLTLSDMNKNDARLIKAIQELKAIVDAQAARIAALEAQ